MLGALEGPLLRRTGELIHAIEDGRRVCERANLDLLAAYERLERLGRPLNAVIDVVDAPDRAAAGSLHGVPVAVKDNMDMRGLVTTNASTVGMPPPARDDAEVVRRLRAAGADCFCKTNLLEYAAGSVNPTYGMTFNPRNPGGRPAGRRRARRRSSEPACAATPWEPTPAARSGSRPPTAGSSA